jgi:hypothetical protein
MKKFKNAINHVLQKSWVCGLIVMLALTAGLAYSSHAVEWQSEEYAVKAAFIYNFAEFITWPDWPSSDNADSFDICIIGNDPFRSAMDALRNENVSGKKVRIKRLNSASSCSHCQIVYISSSEQNRLDQILATLQGFNILTVADSADFAKSGVIFNLYLEDNKVRFEVNIDAVKRSELNISSKLLRLGRIVHDRE